VAISAMAKAVGIVTKWPMKIMARVPKNPTLPTAYPNLKNNMAPTIVEMEVIKTGTVPKLALALISLLIAGTKLN